MKHTSKTEPAGNPPSNRSNARVTHVAPEFFPLPSRGPDPHFGVGRSSYYDLEARGQLRLVRIRKPGNVRGKVLVPYREMSELVRTYQNNMAMVRART